MLDRIPADFSNKQKSDKFDGKLKEYNEYNRSKPGIVISYVLLMTILLILYPVMFYVGLVFTLIYALMKQRIRYRNEIMALEKLQELDEPTYYIHPLRRRVRVCCYKSARMHNYYCLCGKAVPEDLRRIFLEEPEIIKR